MLTEVLQTDSLETRLDYLENELNKIKELRDQFDIPDCNLVYPKKLQIDIDGQAEEIGASINRDHSFQLDNSLASKDSKYTATNAHRRTASTGPQMPGSYSQGV